MLLEDIRILDIAPCVVIPDRIRFRARLSDDISIVMPYLNGIVKNAIYNQENNTLCLTRDERLITLYPREVTVAKALDGDDACAITAWLKELINETYRNRENIAPVYGRRSRPAPLALYGWLPKKSNCRLCGEQTCLAFAAQLVMERKTLADCPLIWEPGREDLVESLKELLSVMA